MPAPWMELATTQDRTLGRRQAMRLGMSEDHWQWQLDRGLWKRTLPGVVTVHSGEPTMRQLLWSSVIKAGRDAVLAGDAVLLERGFPFDGIARVDVAVDRTAPKAYRLQEDLTYRPRSVSGVQRMRAEGAVLPQMSLPFATAHAAAWASTDRGAEFRLAVAVQRGLVRADDLRSTLLALTHLPRHTMLLVALEDVANGAHAMSELDFLKLCRRFGIPEPDELQVRVRTGRGTRYLDFRYRRQRVRGEIDGAHHMSVQTWEADMSRGNDLAIAGRGSREIELRFSGSQVRHDQGLVARQLRTALG